MWCVELISMGMLTATGLLHFGSRFGVLFYKTFRGNFKSLPVHRGEISQSYSFSFNFVALKERSKERLATHASLWLLTVESKRGRIKWVKSACVSNERGDAWCDN